MTLRKATIQDINLLIKLRFDYLTEDNGSLSEPEKTQIETQLKSYFAKHIPQGTFICFFAEENGQVVSTAFLAVNEKPANPAFITGRTGTLLNVFTYPEFRRKGFAEKVVIRIMDEAKTAGISSINLSATESGKPLYEKLGFTQPKYTEMKKRL
ncbi:MAG: GNAT family N-acetyltransferase [Clostridiales bacterium]|nr:GNAT family N-acetyltransferase [Clostridiales bacterium]